MFPIGMQNRWSTARNSQATPFTDQYDAKATRGRSMRGMKASMNDCVGAGFMVCEGRGCLGCCIRWLLCVFTLALAATSGAGVWVAYHNLHLRFWLAHLIYLAMASLTASLALTFFSFAYKAYVTSVRLSSRDQRASGSSMHGARDPCCVLSIRTLRTLFFLVFLTAGCSVIAGGMVLQFGGAMEKQLLHKCGKSGTTHYLESAYQGLKKFQDKCYEDAKYKNKPINECPGYKPAEPAYAGYLKYLEATTGCMGFCNHSSTPLYAVPEMGEANHLSCGTYVANFIWSTSLAVGTTNTVIGICLLCISMALLCYDDL